MRVLDFLNDADVFQLDVEVLVYALERAADLNVVLELDCDFVVDQSLEETGPGLVCRDHADDAMDERGR